MSATLEKRFNIWVLLGFALLAIVLGVLNNRRVFEEQRVEIFTTEATE